MEVHIDLHVLPTMVGRKSPIYDKYRADWKFSRKVLLAGPIDIPGGWPIEPGNSRGVIAHPMSPALWKDVKEGMQCLMMEGGTCVGVGRVTKVLDQ
jgi:hypothetical protein